MWGDGPGAWVRWRFLVLRITTATSPLNLSPSCAFRCPFFPFSFPCPIIFASYEISSQCTNASFSPTRFSQQCRFLALFKCLRKGFFFIVFSSEPCTHARLISVLYLTTKYRRPVKSLRFWTASVNITVFLAASAKGTWTRCRRGDLHFILLPTAPHSPQPPSPRQSQPELSPPMPRPLELR